MLIQALNDYYDILFGQGKLLPDGFSNVDIHYLVYLNPDGTIDGIIDWQETEEIKSKNGKVKEIKKARKEVMPQRTEKPGIDSNFIEHRPLYLFGLNYQDGEFKTTDSTNKAEKSHKIFKDVNLEFIEGIDTPVVNAYRNFIQNWEPGNETGNVYLSGIGKKYGTSGYAFCLSGTVDLLHKDKELNERWLSRFSSNKEVTDGAVIAQCAVTGENMPIARVHSKIKGIFGATAMGSVLVSFKHSSEESYGNKQSYNSNISEKAMEKYTKVLNYISSSKNQKSQLDDITVFYWAMSRNEKCNDIMSALLFDNRDTIGIDEIEGMMKSLIQDAREGNILSGRMKEEDIDPDVNFYILGIKPNVSRIAMKFFYRRRFGEILLNIARHQDDLQVSEKVHTISMWQIKKELVSPKSNIDTVDPALMAKIFEAVIYGTRYPRFLLATVVRRVKTDTDDEKKKNVKLNRVRAGIIKAYINREARLSNKKEELSVALDKENKTPAYLCGRLFAVLEDLQQDSARKSKESRESEEKEVQDESKPNVYEKPLNRTIKDAYFSSAASKPATIFPKLLKLAQNHLRKSNRPGFYNKLVQEIIDNLEGGFPDTLSLVEQGKFIIGYYQQYQSFFVKNNNKQDEDKEDN